MTSSGANHGARVLVLEIDPVVAAAVANLLPREFSCRIVPTAQEAELQLDREAADLLVCADDLPDESGLMFLARTRDKWGAMKRILLVPDPDGEMFFIALREIPRLSFLTKPLDKRDFHRVIHHALWESSSDPSDGDQEPALIPQESAGEQPSKGDSHVIGTADVLILEADPTAALRVSTLLPWGFRHRNVASVESAEALLNERTFDFLICADDLPDESGLMFLARTQSKWKTTKRILMAPDPDGEFFFQVSQEIPHFLYLRKPVDKTALLHLLRRGLHDSPADEEGDSLPEEENPALNRGVFSLATGTFAILAGAVLVFGVLLLIYELKCHFGDFMPEGRFTDFFQR